MSSWLFFIAMILVAVSNTLSQQSVRAGAFIKTSFVVDQFHIVVDCQCIPFCARKLQQKAQVVQIQTTLLNGGSKVCYCSRIKSQYVNMFPNRYLQFVPNNATVSNNVFVVKETSEPALVPAQPLLFYPLDDVSEGGSEGLLSNQSLYQVTFKPSRPAFDCVKTFTNKRKFMRMEASSGSTPRYEIFHNGSAKFNGNINNFTIMIWFKKRMSSIPLAVMVEAMNYDYTSRPWNIQLYNTIHTVLFTVNSLFQYYSSSIPAMDYWTLASVVVNGTQGYFYLNQTSINSVVDAAVLSLGNTILIGVRYWQGNSENGLVFDGCLGHFAIFPKALTGSEIQQFSLIMDDSEF